MAATVTPLALANGAAGFEVFWMDKAYGSRATLLRGLLPDGTVGNSCRIHFMCPLKSTYY